MKYRLTQLMLAQKEYVTDEWLESCASKNLTLEKAVATYTAPSLLRRHVNEIIGGLDGEATADTLVSYILIKFPVITLEEKHETD